MTESCHLEKDRIEGDTIILHAPLDSSNSLLKNLVIVTAKGEKKYQIKKTKHGKFLMN